MIRRINLYGGPGSGKSTNASMLFATCKSMVADQKLDATFELIQEEVKTWAYEGRRPIGFDQVKLFASQMNREELPLRNGVDFVISDSPLLLNLAYAKKNCSVGTYEGLRQIWAEFELQYPSFNIFLCRGNKPYVSNGRFETHDEAKKMDEAIIEMLNSEVDSWVSVGYNDFPTLLAQVKLSLEMPDAYQNLEV